MVDFISSWLDSWIQDDHTFNRYHKEITYSCFFFDLSYHCYTNIFSLLGWMSIL